MQSIEKIYQEYYTVVFKYLVCLTGNSDIAEELTQETFYKMIKKIHTFKGNSKLSVWLCEIAKNLWYDELRKRKLKTVSYDELKDFDLSENKESIENEYINNESKTYWMKKEILNLSLNINISTMSGTENIVKNGKIRNFEILKFAINPNVSVNTRTFRQKKYYQLYYEGDTIFIDADTFFVERIQDRKEKYVSAKTKEYRVTTANVGWREVEKPDLSKYTLIEKE